MSIALLDYRRRVAEAYAGLRAAAEHDTAADTFRRWKDELFLTHPLSPLDEDQKRGFQGLFYYPYDPAYRVAAVVVPAAETVVTVLLTEGETRLVRFAQAEFSLPGGTGRLDLYWMGGYGGGLFVPFTDTTRGRETYGGGRYLLDTIKGADLGMEADRLILDFNLAYQPSCAYSVRWVCPLAPAANHIPFDVPAGEQYVSPP